MRTILHIDFNSYFATVEQQANPRLRGKPVGVTGGDRMKRTVLGAASVEAKRFGVKTGMRIWEAKKLCPQIILVPGDSDKYLETTKRFLNILKDYSPDLEVFSIDEAFLEIPPSVIASPEGAWQSSKLGESDRNGKIATVATLPRDDDNGVKIAQEIKSRIRSEIGEWITCSIGISYNKLMAKLAGSLQKPDGLVMIENQEEAIKVLDKIELDEICGIGPRIKKRLNNLGIFNFRSLRQAPLESLLASFKSYGQILYNMTRGIDNSQIVPFHKKEEVKSIGHRHTIDHDTNDEAEIRQILLKLTELIARRLRAKNLVGKTIRCWYRQALDPTSQYNPTSEVGVRLHLGFMGDGMQTTIAYTSDGLEIFKAAWKIFHQIWNQGTPSISSGSKIRMIGVSISNLKSQHPRNLSLLPETGKQETMLRVIDAINDKYGEFTLVRGALLGSSQIKRKPNPFLSDRRFKL
ncbi:MAG: DNA polymerase IV [Patescibacteria group bacterium]|nr:DNA polymerase IV [Patescibacteria group bacterium]